MMNASDGQHASIATGETFANADVLSFYRVLPFNYRNSAKAEAKAVRSVDVIGKGYPVIVPLMKKGTTVLDVGCGAGWFSLGAAYHHGCSVSGIDFNEVAVERAREVARVLNTPITLAVADLFRFEPTTRADLVASIGVLHHTDNCAEAVRRCCTHFVKPGGHVFIGLYHSYGRRPFLEYFRRMRDAGEGEEQMLAAYKKLHPLADDILLRSWFRDQVLHPRETQHTLAEMLPILNETGMRLVSTSINGFAPIADLQQVLALEPAFETVGMQRLAAGQYFPGFFLFLARKEI